MKNEIIYVKKENLKKLKSYVYSNDNIFCVEINGKNCMCLSDYLTDISTKFKFPIIAKGLDGYNDWMTDLTWIDLNDIVIIINDYEKFLCLDLLAKRKVIENFEQSILPWWELEVCNCVVDGRIRKFTVYLVF